MGFRSCGETHARQSETSAGTHTDLRWVGRENNKIR